MRLSRKQGYLIIGIIALSFLALAVLTINQHIGEANYQPGADGEAGPQQGSKWTDVAIVLYTFVLTVAAVGTWYVMAVQTDVLDQSNALLKKSNETAHASLDISKEARQIAIDGLAETKRSVDAFLRAERGRLMFDHMVWSEYHVGCTIWFKNIGKRAVIVRAFEAQYEPEGTRLPDHNPFKPALGCYRVVEPGDFFIAGIDPSAEETTHHLPSTEIRERLRSNKGIYIMFQIMYEPLQASNLLLQITGNYDPAAEVMKTYIGRVREGVSDFKLPELIEKRKPSKP